MFPLIKCLSLLLRPRSFDKMFNVIKRCNSSTIYSLSTNIKPVGSAVAVIRVSGQRTREALNHLIRKKTTIGKCIGNPRTAVFTHLHDCRRNELLDSLLVIFFEGPFSYTGEDMCELHVHGSHAVINGVLSVLGVIDGFRPALNGEFTKRALINNKIDLIQVEAINDLIRAQTDSQRRRALTAVDGSVSRTYDKWRTDIINIMANIEAIIDFGEEELIDNTVFSNLKNQIDNMNRIISQHLKNIKSKSALIKDGLRVGIIGPPNVGKSSLINKLSERQISIVSDISGTTRDIIETWLNINGYSVSLSDSAGIKSLDTSCGDPIEREGINRALDRSKYCDLILFVMDAKTLIDTNFADSIIKPNYLDHIRENGTKIIYLINKIDLLTKQEYNVLDKHCRQLSDDFFPISCKTSIGFHSFIQALENIVEHLCGNPLAESLFTTARQESHLNKSVQQLKLSLEALDRDIAVAAHHLREAAQQIAHITGRITAEDVLDVIFKDFCIGK